MVTMGCDITTPREFETSVFAEFSPWSLGYAEPNASCSPCRWTEDRKLQKEISPSRKPGSH